RVHPDAMGALLSDVPELGRVCPWSVAAFAVAVVGAAVYYGAAPAFSWLADVPAAQPATQVAPEPLPMVRTTDTLLDRARELYAGGHLHDALRTLDRIGIADPLRADADRLRAEIQRDLLGTRQ